MRRSAKIAVGIILYALLLFVMCLSIKKSCKRASKR